MLAAFHPNIFPSQERLAEQRGVSVRTINRYLDELEAMGLITRFQRKGTSTRYRLNTQAIARYKPVPAAPDATVTEPSRVEAKPSPPTNLPF